MAAAVKPAAQIVAASQDKADLARHPDRFSSLRQVADKMEAIQPRGDLPDAPALDSGGDPDLWRRQEPVVDLIGVPAELEPTPDQAADEVLQDLDAELLAQARKDHPEWEWD